MQTNLSYRPDIDGLRAIAVVGVIAFHAFPNALPGGFVGVDVFFVISGYLISGILLREIDAGRFSIANFYLRRARRIFPALALVLAVCLVLGSFLLLPDEFAQLGKHTVAGAGFSSNVLLWRESGYFDTASERKPLLHLWSLGVEEQFYVVWPLLLWAGARLRKITPVMLAVIALSFVLNVAIVHAHSAADFFLPLTRLWELGVGGLLARRSRSSLAGVSDAPSLRQDVQGCAGLLLLGGAFVGIGPGLEFPGWWATLPVCGTLMLIDAGPGAVVGRGLLANRALVFVGLVSYPLYLWHWPALVFARVFLHGEPSVPQRLVVVGLGFVAALLTYRYVESPVRVGGRLAVRAAIFGLVATAAAGALVYAADGVPARFSERARGLIRDLHTESQRHERAFCPDSLRAHAPSLDWCESFPGAEVALVGDSHAEHLYSGLWRVLGEHLMMIGTNSCPPVLGVDVTVRGVRADEACAIGNEQIVDYLIADSSVRVVVMSFFGTYAQSVGFAAEHRDLQPDDIRFVSRGGACLGTDRAALFECGLQAEVARLQDAGKRVAIVVDVPEMPFFPQDCVPRPFTDACPPCSVGRREIDERQRSYREMLARVAAARPGLEILDASSVICDQERCSAEQGGHLLYRDSHHLSARGSQAVADYVVQWSELARFGSSHE